MIRAPSARCLLDFTPKARQLAAKLPGPAGPCSGQARRRRVTDWAVGRAESPLAPGGNVHDV
jgi:hypothetical protein